MKNAPDVKPCIWCMGVLNELENQLVIEKKLGSIICFDCAQTRESRLRSVFEKMLSPEQKEIFKIYEETSNYVTSNIIRMT